MTCPFELNINEQPTGEKCKDCFWWMHLKNKCIIQGSADANKDSSEGKAAGVKQFLNRCGFPIGKVGYRNTLAALELLFLSGTPGPNEITFIYQNISRNSGRTVSSIRQSIRAAIIWAWENGTLKELFPNRQKKPRLVELFYYLQNYK